MVSNKIYHLKEDEFGQFERLVILGKILELMILESYQDLIIVLVKLYKIVVLLMMQMR